MSLPEKMPRTDPAARAFGTREEARRWHAYYNHPSGLGTACGATVGCFTINEANVNCPACLKVLEDERVEGV